MTLEPALAEHEAPPPIADSSNAVEDSNAGLVRAATIIGAGNVASRILGLVRETVIAYLFGASGYVSIFRVAATLIQTLYDFLVGGMVSAALVPVFSEFASGSDENRQDLWRIASIVINVLALGLAAAVLVLELLAPQVVWVLGSGYDPALQDEAVQMVRLILPAVFFLGLSGVVAGLLYSLKRFTLPAFTTSVYNLGIVLTALALSRVFGITSLIVGILLGAAMQVVLQIPGLRDMRYHLAIDFSHPALRKILRLYAPVVAGLAIQLVGVAIDRNLASHTGDQSLAWMQDATVLTQFPLGLVATAISFAILPELSRQSAAIAGPAAPPNSSGLGSPFQATLAFGVKLVLLLILPAALGLFVLARPVVALLFEHGAFTGYDTLSTSNALRFYLIGLPFAAIDQPLVFAFYARKNTLLPNLVAFAGVAIYLAVALPLLQPLGMIGLVMANSAQLTGHAIIMIWLVQTRLGGFGRQGIGSLLAKALGASAVMGGIAFVLVTLMARSAAIIQVGVAGVICGLAYVLMIRLLRVQEAERLWEMVQARVSKV